MWSKAVNEDSRHILPLAYSKNFAFQSSRKGLEAIPAIYRSRPFCVVVMLWVACFPGKSITENVAKIHHGQNLECWSHLNQLRFD